MRIGYASQTVGIPGVKFKTTKLKNTTDEKLIELIHSNLHSLDLIFDYNIENNIQMFRISSDIIPFGSHEANKLKWWELFQEKLAALGKKAQDNDIRLSMHPGQYTVLNSPNIDVVHRAAADLLYHTRFLDAMNLDESHKIILHVGGVYGDKKSAMERFIENYKQLDERIHKRLIIENDDRRQLYLAIQALPITMREVLMESTYLHMKDDEIATLHHLTPENVRQIRSRAKKKLIEMLKEG